MKHINHFIFDIEGTVAPISFVTNVLFPYSRKNLLNYLQKSPLQSILFENLKSEYELDFHNEIYNLPLEQNSESIYKYLTHLIAIDKKSPTLKEVQGIIWKEGYENGELKSVIYPDTLDYFQYLKKQNKIISIYSSGSILAQKLIFQYSNLGNLNEWISNYFDTGIGNKKESKSYENICSILKVKPDNICFFTDIKEEAIAAKSVHLNVYLVNREGNKPQHYNEVENINDFKSLIQ